MPPTYLYVLTRDRSLEPSNDPTPRPPALLYSTVSPREHSGFSRYNLLSFLRHNFPSHSIFTQVVESIILDRERSLHSFLPECHYSKTDPSGITLTLHVYALPPAQEPAT